MWEETVGNSKKLIAFLNAYPISSHRKYNPSEARIEVRISHR
jgi:hypothetical protein